MRKSSGYEILDKEALDWISRSEPYPSIPSELELSEFKMPVRLTFDLKE
ncbi:MAG: energy transducer TonB [Planctomycetota bacterium]